jgi:hypothetical protein
MARTIGGEAEIEGWLVTVARAGFFFDEKFLDGKSG